MADLAGYLLALAILAAWSLLHAYGVFFLPLGESGWIIPALLVALLTWLSVGLFIVAHDAMHGSLMPRHPRLNHATGALCLLLYANFSYHRVLPEHHRHHAHPGSADDPDFHPDHPRSLPRWYGRFMGTYFGWREALWMSLRVAAYLLLGADYASILLFFALPGILSSLQLFFFGTYLPHRHHDEPFADHHNARSNDYAALWSLLTCFHFGYHREHHLSPGTPWWRLPAARRTGVRP